MELEQHSDFEPTELAQEESSGEVVCPILSIRKKVRKKGFQASLATINPQKGLIYLSILVSETNVAMLLDTSVTNSFMTPSCVTRLELESEGTKEPVQIVFAQGTGHSNKGD